jgi:hypothetical protein
MRRSLFGLLTLVAIAGLLLTTSCQRAATLRVVSINHGMTLRSDIADFMNYFDRVDSEEVVTYQAMPDSVEVELQYVEIGAGLPTWTPYEALLNQAKITYVGTTEAGIDYSTYATTVVPLTQAILADPTASKTTKLYLTAVSGSMKDAVFGDQVLPPGDGGYNIIDLVTATITFAGYDSVANQKVQAAGKLQIEFGNFYDDTTKFGK